MGDTQKTYSGGCLCGSVKYEIEGPLRPVVACHCRMCARTSGNFVTATQGYWRKLKLISDEGLKWYQSSDAARRGFCRECGGNLFFHRFENERISIMAGSLDQPTGLQLAVHIYPEDASDYYEICDGLPQLTNLNDMPQLPPDR